MSQVLSELTPSWQPHADDVWNKQGLKSFQRAEQPPAPQEEPPEQKMKASVMSQASKITEMPSYEICQVEWHCAEPGRPDWHLHDLWHQRLNSFLKQLSRQPQRVEG